ncbi:MAG: VOC family protein [Actinomycetota bacterium]|nr:VOC family protein [Actinomycetota bacterium]
MAILELGHTGLHVYDLDTMRDFYERVLELTVTDVDPVQGTVFLSSRPEREHHEMVLAKGRTAPLDTTLLNQISWRVDSVDTLLRYFALLTEYGARIDRVLDHGSAIGIYFLDPEGNKLEVYWQTGDQMPQPFGKEINPQGSAQDVLAEHERLVADGGRVDSQPEISA